MANKTEVLLKAQVAKCLSTWERSARRLSGERRITVVSLGRSVCIPKAVVNAFIKAGTVRPLVRPAARFRSHLKAVS